MRLAFRAASAALFLAGCLSRCAAAQTEIAEVNAIEHQTLLLVLVHEYPDQMPRGRVLKFIIDAQISGVRTHKEFLVKPDRLGDITCDYGFAIFNANYVEISASTSGGDFRKRLPNVFYDRTRPSVALGCRFGLKTIVRSGEGEPAYLFAGPFPKTRSPRERKRMLKQCDKTNYILFRLK